MIPLGIPPDQRPASGACGPAPSAGNTDEFQIRFSKKVFASYKTVKTNRQGGARDLESGMLTPGGKNALERLYRSLNPVRLLAQINQELERLWDLADHPTRKEASVTSFMRQPLPLR